MGSICLCLSKKREEEGRQTLIVYEIQKIVGRKTKILLKSVKFQIPSGQIKFCSNQPGLGLRTNHRLQIAPQESGQCTLGVHGFGECEGGGFLENFGILKIFF